MALYHEAVKEDTTARQINNNVHCQGKKMLNDLKTLLKTAIPWSAENLLTSDSNLTPPTPPYHISSLAFNGRLPINRVHEAETPLIATI